MTASIALYPKEDYLFIQEMRKTVNPSGAEMNKILDLYRKYVQYVWGYVTGCNCAQDISSLWNTLNQWVIKNDSLFER